MRLSLFVYVCVYFLPPSGSAWWHGCGVELEGGRLALCSVLAHLSHFSIYLLSLWFPTPLYICELWRLLYKCLHLWILTSLGVYAGWEICTTHSVSKYTLIPLNPFCARSIQSASYSVSECIFIICLFSVLPAPKANHIHGTSSVQKFALIFDQREALQRII